MPSARVQEVKKLLTSSGYIVYRSGPDVVHLAERVRENLIMDANVSVVTEPQLRVRVITRAQRTDFPSSHETPESLFDRAREIGIAAMARGFREVAAEAVPQLDPGDPKRVLDVWYQVTFEGDIGAIEDLSATVAFALGMDKVVPA
jgi:hypothetical protein